MSKVKVFVYGTLKTGLSNNYILNNHDSTSLGPATVTLSNHVMCSGSYYPFVKPVSPETYQQLLNHGLHGVIHGELFQCEESVMTELLDKLEGYPHNFNRIEVTGIHVDMRCDKFTAWMYVHNSHLYQDDVVLMNGEWWPSPHTLIVSDMVSTQSSR